MKINWLTGKTIIGAALALLAYLLDPQVLAVLPNKVANLLMAIGSFLAVIGLRHAQAKSAEAVKGSAEASKQIATTGEVEP